MQPTVNPSWRSRVRVLWARFFVQVPFLISIAVSASSAALREGRVAAIGTPAEVFADARALEQAQLKPPLALEMARGLGLPPVTSVDGLARLLSGDEE